MSAMHETTRSGWGSGSGEVKIGRDDAIEFFDVLFAEVVFGDLGIAFQYLALRRIFPGGQPHVGAGGVGGGVDDFGGRFAGDGPMQFVLGGGVESFGDRCLGIVVYAALGVDVGDFLVEAAFAGADVTDAL